MEQAGFQHFAQHRPEAEAVIGPRGEHWPRRRLAALANRTARAFRAAGLRAGEALAIASPNCAEFLAVYLGAVDAGLNVVPVNWHLADDEVEFVLRDANVRGLVAHEKLGAARLAALRRALPPGAIAVAIGAARDFAELGRFAADHEEAPLATGPSGRVMAYTSATTGRPKGVVLPASNAREALHRTIAWHRSLGIEIERDNVHLCTSMLYHCAPLEGAIVALHMGHAVVLSERADPETVLALIERHRVTTAFLVPTLLVRLLKLPPETRRRYSTASLRFVVHGGAPCPIDVKRRMLEWWGPIIWEVYAASEAHGAIASPADWLRFPGTVGRPVPGSRIAILDEHGRELPPGNVGLIYMRPHTGDRFAYRGDPEGTERAYRGELVTAGDFGYLNEEGYLFVCDRRADLILSSGMNIYPAEIEQALVQHPAVADCAVVGMPHELFGAVPKAFVQLAAGVDAGAALTADLLAFLTVRLAPMKLPRRIEYVAKLPRDPSGKLRRRLLKERIAEATPA